MGFFSRIFKKEEEIESYAVTTGEFFSWYDTFSREVLDNIKKEFEKKRISIKTAIMQSHQKVIELEDIPIKKMGNYIEETQLIQDHKNSYTQAANRFLISIEMPEKIDYLLLTEFISRYEDLLNEFKKNTQKSQYIIKDNYSEKINDINSQIMIVDQNIRDIIDPRIKTLEQIRQEMQNLQKKIRLQNLAKEVIASEKQKLDEFEDARKKAQNKIEEMKNTPYYSELKKLEEDQASAEKELTHLEKSIYDSFAPLQKAFRKFAKISVTDEMTIERYATNPISTLLDDSNLKIIEILDNMRRSISSGTLEITQDEKAKIPKNLEQLDDDYIKYKRAELESKKDALDSIKKRITLSVVVQTVKEAEYKFNHNQDKIKTLKSNIEKLENIIKGEDIFKLSKYITERIKQNFNIQLKITDIQEV